MRSIGLNLISPGLNHFLMWSAEHDAVFSEVFIHRAGSSRRLDAIDRWYFD